MRRSTRFGLLALVGLLVLVAAYAAYWRVVAGRIREGIIAWQQTETARKVDVSWRELRVAGFPFAFRIEIDDAAFRDHSRSPAPGLRLAHLTGAARPWDFSDWRLAAPAGLAADLAPSGAQPMLQLAARSAEGTVSIGPSGGSWMWVALQDIAVEGAGRVPIQSADAWLILPEKPPVKDTDAAFSLAVDLHQMGVASPPASFVHTIDELALGATVKGAMPAGPMAIAAARWRDAGGTIEVGHLRLLWGGLGISANGTLALDGKLQPIAAFSGGIEGFGAILDALVAADQMTPEQASLVQIALTSLARPGPDGKPQITAPFTIQNGKMYLGPARLGAVPHIGWE